MLLGQQLTANEAKAIGLIWDVVAADDLESHCFELMQRLA